MNLKDFLILKNVYANEIAKLAGCHPQTIRYIAAKKRFPSEKLAAKLSTITEGFVSFEELRTKPPKERCPHCKRYMNIEKSIKYAKQKKQT